jgi:hypothetical protein
METKGIEMIGDPRGENMCFSGGAEGSDILFGECADRCGHRFVHYGFSGHTTSVSQYILTESQLVQADDTLIEVAKDLDRGAFSSYKTYTKNLLRRNYYIVKDVDTVYAVGRLKYDGSEVLGGTGWGVQMAINNGLDLYLYDMATTSWYEYKHYDDGSWLQMTHDNKKFRPPMPKGYYAGIGSQELTEDGRQAIIRLFEE